MELDATQLLAANKPPVNGFCLRVTTGLPYGACSAELDATLGTAWLENASDEPDLVE